ncbi:MAG: hypothetical protein ACOY3Y_15280 [Acidobacteriota bacterium]
MALIAVRGLDAQGTPFSARAEARDESVLRAVLEREGVTIMSARTLPLTRWPFAGQGWPILAWPLAGFFLMSSVVVVVRALLDGSALRVPWAFAVALGSAAGFGWFVGNTLGRLGTHWLLDEARGVWLYTRGLERPALRSDLDDNGPPN